MNDATPSQEPIEVFGPWESPALDHFAASRLKTKRAEKHIADIEALLSNFIKSDFYTVSIEKDARQGTNKLRFDIVEAFPFYDAALLVGDVLHNLRSALDVLYYGTVHGPSNWTRFPIRDTREELITALGAALKKQQIGNAVHDLILDTIKPYNTGNYTLWALDDLNIRDKHQLLIPVVKYLRFDGVRLEDDQQRPVNEHIFYMMDASSRIRLPDDLNITLKDKGRASGAIIFDFGTAFQTEPVIPTLHGIAIEVSRTIEVFQMLGS